ncbi:tetratricopeptide repeat protein [Cohaesibacter intestini]|uniref:tetratricopeptide repeat protein n=1 Tax=Cohaesibacter intestini TaxID=2211145 RepID=UPI001FE08129|nr:tetratricopeptide repeat protein [Cohaesibacter intestini]
MKQTILATALAAGFALASGSAALAVGSDTSAPPKPTPTTKDCEKGEVFNPDTGKCSKPSSKIFSDDQLYDAVREIAYAGHYDWALEVIAAAANPNDPRMLNYKGFIHRKLGHFDRAMDYYKAAIKLDPDYTLARSYMGQGLVSEGKMSAARQQLFEIEQRGGRDSWAYAALEQSIREKAKVY